MQQQSDDTPPEDTIGPTAEGKGPLIVFEDDEFIRKWSGPLLIGPFVPAILALVVIFSGQLLLNTYTGTCGYSLNSFISAAIAVCYLFLLFYAWIFLGDEVRLDFPQLGFHNTVILKPITTLKFVSKGYVVLGLTSFIVWIVGSYLLQLAFFCATTSPGLYQYTRFLVVVYWLGFVIVILSVVNMRFGLFVTILIKQQMRPETVEEMEEKIFRAKFKKFDPEGDTAADMNISALQLEPFLEELGVFVPGDEIASLRQTLDPEDTGTIQYRAIFHWFKNLNSTLDQNEASLSSVDDIDELTYESDELDAARLFTPSSGDLRKRS